MKDMKLNFSLELFWKVGSITFLIIGLASLIGLINNWSLLIWYAKISSTATIVFQFTLSYMFFWMLKGSKKNKAVDKKTDAEMLKVLEDANK